MSPRAPLQSQAMSSAERVRRSRWANRVEAAADNLLQMLQEVPEPLPRSPIIDPELLDRLADFQFEDEVDSDAGYEKVFFLEPGTGHQVSNRRRALVVAEQVLPGARVIDKNTVQLPDWGTCHFSAYTAKRAAMVSSPRRKDNSFGSRTWHHRDHILLFRDARDGRCIVYICDIRQLLDSRAEKRHGVLWDVVDAIAKDVIVVPSADALKMAPEQSS